MTEISFLPTPEQNRLRRHGRSLCCSVLNPFLKISPTIICRSQLKGSFCSGLSAICLIDTSWGNFTMYSGPRGDNEIAAKGGVVRDEEFNRQESIAILLTYSGVTGFSSDIFSGYVSRSCLIQQQGKLERTGRNSLQLIPRQP